MKGSECLCQQPRQPATEQRTRDVALGLDSGVRYPFPIWHAHRLYDTPAFQRAAKHPEANIQTRYIYADEQPSDNACNLDC
jgi:hypothetical protein